MNSVPITRFRRELRKWMRKEEVVHITRNGKPFGVLVPKSTYDILTKRLG